MALEWTNYKYVDDRGSEWTVRRDANVQGALVAAVAIFGDTAADAADPPLPTFIKPRVALCWDPVGHRVRRVTCLTNAATAYSTGGQTVSLEYYGDGSGVNYKVYGYEGEKRRSARPTS